MPHRIFPLKVFFKNGIPIKWSQSVKIPQFLSLQEMSDEGSLEQDARSPGNAGEFVRRDEFGL